jgi:hypothetical protein
VPALNPTALLAFCLLPAGLASVMCRQPRPPPDGQLYAGDDGWLDEIAYLMQTWLVHDHECVGAPPPPRTTSRVEGAHATLETMLRQSTGDLARVAHDVHARILWQATETAGAEARETIRTPAEARSATVLASASSVPCWTRRQRRAGRATCRRAQATTPECWGCCAPTTCACRSARAGRCPWRWRRSAGICA